MARAFGIMIANAIITLLFLFHLVTALIRFHAAGSAIDSLLRHSH